MQGPQLDDFTDREKFLLSYFRVRKKSDSGRLLAYNVTVVSLSIVCLILAFARNDMVLGLVGYLFVLGRLSYLAIEEGRYADDLQSLIKKCDAKLKAAEDQKSEISTNESSKTLP